MPELQEDSAAGPVHGIGDLLPAGDLFGAVDARGGLVALAFGADLGGFGDDQAGAGALAVIFGDQVGRSEEHTSELQSLMRNSYAAFFLIKKKPTKYYNLDHSLKLTNYP